MNVRSAMRVFFSKFERQKGRETEKNYKKVDLDERRRSGFGIYFTLNILMEILK